MGINKRMSYSFRTEALTFCDGFLCTLLVSEGNFDFLICFVFSEVNESLHRHYFTTQQHFILFLFV